MNRRARRVVHHRRKGVRSTHLLDAAVEAALIAGSADALRRR